MWSCNSMVHFVHYLFLEIGYCLSRCERGRVLGSHEIANQVCLILLFLFFLTKQSTRLVAMEFKIILDYCCVWTPNSCFIIGLVFAMLQSRELTRSWFERKGLQGQRICAFCVRFSQVFFCVQSVYIFMRLWRLLLCIQFVFIRKRGLDNLSCAHFDVDLR